MKEVNKSLPATCSHTSLQSSSASFGANKSDTACAKEITQSFSDQDLLQKESEFSFVASSSIDFENKLDIIMSKLDNISFEVGKVSSKMDQKNAKEFRTNIVNTNEVLTQNKLSEDQYASYIGDIKSAKVNSVKTLLDNPLVKNIFTIENCDDGMEMLVCGPCSKSEAC